MTTAMPRTTPKKPPTRVLRVWDLPTRLVHWALLLCFCGALISVNLGEMKAHRVFGLAIFGLVVFRLLWGFLGSETARFRSFLPKLQSVREGLRKFFQKTPPHIGHDALGGLATLALIACLLTTASLGMFSNDDLFFRGPLAHLVTKSRGDTISFIHTVMAKATIGLVLFHILVVLFHLLYKKTDLVSPMVTGRKKITEPSLAEPHFVSARRALVIMMIPLTLIALLFI